MEEWRDIEGFPGYQVSNLGRVKGIRKNVLKHCYTPDSDYPKVTLCVNGRHIDKRVNRLVASAFIENPYNLPLVMHTDNNPMNNSVDNLAWGTYAENNQYMYDCGRHPINLTDEAREKAYAIRRTGVIAINMETGEEDYFVSQHEAARQLNVSQQHIWGVLNGWRRSTGGYRFKYADDEKESNRHPHRYNIRIRPIKAIDLCDNKEYVFKTIKDASIELGISYHRVCKILSGQLDSFNNYTFEYIDKEECYG